MADRDDPGPAATREELAELLAAWLPGQRWFAGKGHVLTRVTVTEMTPLRPRGSSLRESAEATLAAAVESTLGRLMDLSEQPEIVHLVVGVCLDGDQWQTYQVPICLYEASKVGELGGRVLVGTLRDGRTVLDALTDPFGMTALLHDPSDVPVLDPGQTHARPDEQGGAKPPSFEAARLDPAWDRLPPRGLGAEQSNTSVVVGESALVKVYRQLVPGKNPDIEIHAALSGSPYLARCLGWVNGGWRDPAADQWRSGHLAMVQELLAPATDGWELACERVEAGQSFAPEAHALGVATAEVHADLRRAFPTEQLSAEGRARLVSRLSQRLEEAVGLVPEVAPLAPELRTRIEALTALGEPIETQRVHGDLHLGQVMLATDGWKLLDFEGEPGAAAVERTSLDHALRDVAGMLRSFAYAGAQGGAERPPAEVAAWRDDCEQAFLAGYASASGRERTPASQHDVLSAGERTILNAYLVDKAAYEAAYEKRSRPDWLGIPLAALRQLASSE